MERKLQDVLKPLTPLRIHTYRKDSDDDQKPQQLLRENTYDVIEPIFVNGVKVKKRDRSIPRRSQDDKTEEKQPKVSPKTRFKNAARQVAKLSSMPETGKLLCLRERECFKLTNEEQDCFRLQELPRTPTQKLSKLSEIFQSLDTKSRHRDKMKKENSWF